MGKIAFIFAGQGAQYPGMGQELAQCSPAAAEIFAKLDALRPGTSAQCFGGTDEELKETKNTQPCMFAVELAAAAALEEGGLRADMAAGFSLGEIGALTYTRAVDLETGFHLVCRRGELMQAAAEEQPTAMAAVLKLSNEEVEQICAQFAQVYPVNYNCPGQIVIGGEADAVARAGELAKAAGARRLLPLRVSGPFHTPLMQPAAKALHERFETEPFGEMQIPVLFNCLGQEKGSETIPSLLERQVVSPVMMEDTLRELARLGVDTFVEIGPGTVLSGFVRKTLGASVNCYNIENVDGLEKIVDALKA